MISMRESAARAAIAALAGLVSCSALAYGPQGHQYVGAIADGLLAPNAKKQVAQILGMPLRVAATWADCVKDVAKNGGRFTYRPNPRFHEACQAFESPQGVKEMEDYVRRNTTNCHPRRGMDACHKQYHYTDVAIQHERYDRGYVGTSDHDIVAASTAAIAVLQGKPAPAPFKIKDKREALLLLAHLVGDLHQPLHVGAIYLDRSGKPINPDVGGRPLDSDTDTRGGNSIRVGSKNLHSDWDAVTKSLEPTKVTELALERARAVGPSKGATETWPAQWATETLAVSRGAFAEVSFSPSGGRKGRWVAHFDDRKAYVKNKNRIQAEELAKAGARLAQVLNTLWP